MEWSCVLAFLWGVAAPSPFPFFWVVLVVLLLLWVVLVSLLFPLCVGVSLRLLGVVRPVSLLSDFFQNDVTK